VRLPDHIQCLGVGLRLHVDRVVNQSGSRRARYHGVRGDLSIMVEGLLSEDGLLLSASWEGCAIVTYRWTSGAGETSARHTLPLAAGASPEGCAETLAQIVGSLALAIEEAL